MKFPTENKSQDKAKMPKSQWEIKDRHIQISQAVNLAVEELCSRMSNTAVFPAEVIKEEARKYDKILTELKEEDD